MGAVKLNMSYAKPDRATDIAVRDDGSIVVAGYLQDGDNHKNYVISFNEYGDYQSAFNNGSPYVFTQSGFHYYDPAIAIDPDGNTVIASQALRMTPYTWGMNMSRIRPNGTLDTGYGASGYRYTTLAGLGFYVPNDVELLPTGQALVPVSEARGTPSSGTSATYVARFTANGALDTGFAGVGYVRSPVSDNTSGGTFFGFVSLAPDGKFYVGGTNEDLFFALRYQGDALDVVPNDAPLTDHNNVARSTVQTSDPFTVSGLTPGARVPITVTGGAYSRNGLPATSLPGYVSNGDVIRLVHTSSPNYTATVTTMARFGGVSAANNRGMVLGNTAIATFSTRTEAETPPPGTGPGGGEES
jgi:hypothetical protein